MPPRPIQPRPFANLCEILAQPPDAVADVRGSGMNPRLGGTVRFYRTPYGVLVYAESDGETARLLMWQGGKLRLDTWQIGLQ